MIDHTLTRKKRCSSGTLSNFQSQPIIVKFKVFKDHLIQNYKEPDLFYSNNKKSIDKPQ